MHTVEEILEILAAVKPGLHAAADEELVRSGKLDSVDIMALVLELGERFDIDVAPTDLKEENFATAAAILALVQRLEG